MYIYIYVVTYVSIYIYINVCIYIYIKGNNSTWKLQSNAKCKTIYKFQPAQLIHHNRWLSNIRIPLIHTDKQRELEKPNFKKRRAQLEKLNITVRLDLYIYRAQNF